MEKFEGRSKYQNLVSGIYCISQYVIVHDLQVTKEDIYDKETFIGLLRSTRDWLRNLSIDDYIEIELDDIRQKTNLKFIELVSGLATPIRVSVEEWDERVLLTDDIQKTPRKFNRIEKCPFDRSPEVRCDKCRQCLRGFCGSVDVDGDQQTIILCSTHKFKRIKQPEE